MIGVAVSLGNRVAPGSRVGVSEGVISIIGTLALSLPGHLFTLGQDLIDFLVYLHTQMSSEVSWSNHETYIAMTLRTHPGFV